MHPEEEWLVTNMKKATTRHVTSLPVATAGTRVNNNKYITVTCVRRTLWCAAKRTGIRRCGIDVATASLSSGRFPDSFLKGFRLFKMMHFYF